MNVCRLNGIKMTYTSCIKCSCDINNVHKRCLDTCQGENFHMEMCIKVNSVKTFIHTGILCKNTHMHVIISNRKNVIMNAFCSENEYSSLDANYSVKVII